MKIKRKARTKLINTVDILKPIDILTFGSEDDPCFGKHFDPKTTECSRCGDSELCAMKMGQLQHVTRDKIESKQAFKDMEERDIKPIDKKEIRKTIKGRIREFIKLHKSGVKESIVINDLFTTYSKDGFTKNNIKAILKRVVEKSLNITYKNDKLIWTKN